MGSPIALPPSPHGRLSDISTLNHEPVSAPPVQVLFQPKPKQTTILPRLTLPSDDNKSVAVPSPRSPGSSSSGGFGSAMKRFGSAWKKKFSATPTRSESEQALGGGGSRKGASSPTLRRRSSFFSSAPVLPPLEDFGPSLRRRSSTLGRNSFKGLPGSSSASPSRSVRDGGISLDGMVAEFVKTENAIRKSLDMDRQLARQSSESTRRSASH